MKETQVTKVAYHDAGEEAVLITTEAAFDKKQKEATEAKEEPPVQLVKQSFLFKSAETVDECVALAGGSGTGSYDNIDVFLGVFNYAASLRQHNWANDLIKGSDFAAQEGAIDASGAVGEKVERAKMSPEEKAISALAKGGIKISADQLRAALALIQQQAGASVGA